MSFAGGDDAVETVVETVETVEKGEDDARSQGAETVPLSPSMSSMFEPCRDSELVDDLPTPDQDHNQDPSPVKKGNGSHEVHNTGKDGKDGEADHDQGEGDGDEVRRQNKEVGNEVAPKSERDSGDSSSFTNSGRRKKRSRARPRSPLFEEWSRNRRDYFQYDNGHFEDWKDFEEVDNNYLSYCYGAWLRGAKYPVNLSMSPHVSVDFATWTQTTHLRDEFVSRVNVRRHVTS